MRDGWEAHGCAKFEFPGLGSVYIPQAPILPADERERVFLETCDLFSGDGTLDDENERALMSAFRSQGVAMVEAALAVVYEDAPKLTGLPKPLFQDVYHYIMTGQKKSE